MMIKSVSHTGTGIGTDTDTGTDPAGFGLALDVAYELHAPTGGRAPEVALTRPAAHRSTTSRSRRRTTAARG